MSDNLLNLREWLAANGFRVEANPLRDPSNECAWYAFKRTSHPSRECECNDGKPAQIVVTPHAFTMRDRPHESVEVEVCGQYGCWWRLTAYSISPAELPAHLPSIEASLIAAWNALNTGEAA